MMMKMTPGYFEIRPSPTEDDIEILQDAPRRSQESKKESISIQDGPKILQDFVRMSQEYKSKMIQIRISPHYDFPDIQYKRLPRYP